MNIHNELPRLLHCLRKWETCPTAHEFARDYAEPLATLTGNFFDDFYEEVAAIDWPAYRAEALKLDPAREEQRVRTRLAEVESLLSLKLQGDILIIGAFTLMDGYLIAARTEYSWGWMRVTRAEIIWIF